MQLYWKIAIGFITFMITNFSFIIFSYDQKFLPTLIISCIVYLNFLFVHKNFSPKRDLPILFFAFATVFLDYLSKKASWIDKSGYIIAYILTMFIKKEKIQKAMNYDYSFGLYLIFSLFIIQTAIILSGLMAKSQISIQIVYLTIDMTIKAMIPIFCKKYNTPNEIIIFSYSLANFCFSDMMQNNFFTHAPKYLLSSFLTFLQMLSYLFFIIELSVFCIESPKYGCQLISDPFSQLFTRIMLASIMTISTIFILNFELELLNDIPQNEDYHQII